MIVIEQRDLRLCWVDSVNHSVIFAAALYVVTGRHRRDEGVICGELWPAR